jgi:hypothetical protein
VPFRDGAHYQWRSARGVGAFVLDSTWAGCTTLAGAVVNVAGLCRSDSGYHEGLSRRHNRHVYAKGVQLRRGFATTFGNVITGAGDLTSQRRAKLVTDHEDVHAWQARWFGPAYPVLYGSWWLGGAIVGTAAWASGMRDRGLRPLIDAFGYYLNPFEWWAYSRDDHWPPICRRSRWVPPTPSRYTWCQACVTRHVGCDRSITAHQSRSRSRRCRGRQPAVAPLIHNTESRAMVVGRVALAVRPSDCRGTCSHSSACHATWQASVNSVAWRPQEFS